MDTEDIPKEFTCTECNKQFRMHSKFKKHLDSHNVTCDKCNITFKTYHQKKRHDRSEHPQTREKKCRVCPDVSFKTEEEYLLHIRDVHKGNLVDCHMCNVCGKTFKTRNELMQHINSKCGTEKQYTCKVCGQKLMSPGSLYNHMRRHNDKASFMCRFCAKLFLTAGQLKVHERIHTQQKDFVCDVCGKGFCHRQSLITHSTVHTGIKPYQCEGCGKSFSCVGNLLKHRKSHADTCGLLPLTTHRVQNPSTKIKVRINTPESSKLKKAMKNKELQEKFAMLDFVLTKSEISDSGQNNNVKNGMDLPVMETVGKKIGNETQNKRDLKDQDDLNQSVDAIHGNEKIQVSDTINNFYEDNLEENNLLENVAVLGSIVTKSEISESRRNNNSKNENDLSLKKTLENKIGNETKSKPDYSNRDNFNLRTDEIGGIGKSEVYGVTNTDNIFEDNLEVCIEQDIIKEDFEEENDLRQDCNDSSEKPMFKRTRRKKNDPLLNLKIDNFIKERNLENGKAANCKYCNKWYTHFRWLYKHEQEHEANDVSESGEVKSLLFKCSCCKKGFGTKDEVRQHQQLAHSDLLSCHDCGDKIFANIDSLRSHIHIFHNGLPKKEYVYICEKCGKKFRQKALLQVHNESNCGTGPFFQCEVCQKEFSSDYTRKSHMRVHTSEKNLSCKFCGKSFHWKGQLKVHERSHTGEKPYTCLFCPSAFAYRDSLITHSTLHTGIKPYFCKGCGWRFSCIGNLVKHKVTHASTCGAWYQNSMKEDAV